MFFCFVFIVLFFNEYSDLSSTELFLSKTKTYVKSTGETYEMFLRFTKHDYVPSTHVEAKYKTKIMKIKARRVDRIRMLADIRGIIL